MKSTNQIDETTNGFWGSNTSKTLITLTAGAVVGAATALLLAPKAGAETRRAITDGASRVKSTVTDTIQKGIDKLSGKVLEAEEGTAGGSQYASSSPGSSAGSGSAGTGRKQSTYNNPASGSSNIH